MFVIGLKKVVIYNDFHFLYLNTNKNRQGVTLPIDAKTK